MKHCAMQHVHAAEALYQTRLVDYRTRYEKPYEFQ